MGDLAWADLLLRRYCPVGIIRRELSRRIGRDDFSDLPRRLSRSRSCRTVRGCEKAHEPEFMRNAGVAAERARRRGAAPVAVPATGRGALRFLLWTAFVMLWAAAIARLPDVWDARRAAALERRLLSPPCRDPEGIIAQLAELGPAGLPSVVRALGSSENGVVQAAQRAIWRELKTESDVASRSARIEAVVRTMLAEYPHWGEATRSAACPLLRVILNSPRQAGMLSPSRLEQLKALAAGLENEAGRDAALPGSLPDQGGETEPLQAERDKRREIAASGEAATRVRLESGSRLGVRSEGPPGRAEGTAWDTDPGVLTDAELAGTKTRLATHSLSNDGAFAESASSPSRRSDGAAGIDRAVYSLDLPTSSGQRSFGPGGRDAVRVTSATEDVSGAGDRSSSDRGLPREAIPEGEAAASPLDEGLRALSGRFAGVDARRRDLPHEYAIPPEIRNLFLRLVSGALEERRLAAEALRVRVRSPGVIQAGGLVFDPSPQQRREAVARLWTIPDIDPLPFLFELAVDSDAAVRREALIALGSVANDSIRDWVISSCRADESPDIRAISERIRGGSAATATR